MEEFFDRAFTREYLVAWLIAGGVALFILSGFVWWTQVYESPYNVFWGMLSNNLETTYVTKHITENGNGEKLNQYIYLNFGVRNYAYGLTTLTDASGTAKTQTIGTLHDDYVRYTAITGSIKSDGSKAPNFSQVLNKWAKSPVANTSSKSSSPPFFIQTLLGLEGGNLLPIADLSSSDRQGIIQLLHQSSVFITSYSTVKKHTLNGQSVYTYAVVVEPVAYVSLEQRFAADLGIKALDSVNPNSYEGEQPIDLTLTIDRATHHLLSVGYPGTNHTETYSSYGVPANISIPKKTISDAELQKLLGTVQ